MNEHILKNSLLKWHPIFRQTLVNSAIILGFFSCGCISGFPTILIPQILSKNSSTNATNEDISADPESLYWIASIQGISQIPGIIFIPIIMQAKGRRIAFIISCVPMFIAWIAIYTATNSSTLIICQGILGISNGGLIPLGIIAMAEFTTPRYRGAFLAAKSTAFCIGVWFSNLLGTFLHWRTVSLISSFPVLMVSVLVFTWPETPLWLAHKGQFEKCQESFYWLRGNRLADKRELEILIQIQKERKRRNLKPSKHNFREIFMKKILKRDFYLPTVLVICLNTYFQACGKLIMTCYPIMIVDSITNMKSFSYIAMNVYDSVTIIGVLISCYLSKKCKRRCLFFWSSCFGCVFLSCTAFYVYLMKSGVVSNASIIPSIPLLGFILATSLGSIIVPMIVMGEIVPFKHKGLTMSIGALYHASIITLILKLTPNIILLISVEGVFLLTVLISLCCILFLYKYLPETKDRTLQEIEDFYEYGRFVVRDCQKEKNSLEADYVIIK